VDVQHQRAYRELLANHERYGRYVRAAGNRLHIQQLSAMLWLHSMYHQNLGELVEAVVNGQLVKGAIVPGVEEAEAWLRKAELAELRNLLDRELVVMDTPLEDFDLEYSRG
jgi:urocanate hydratase